MGGLRNWTIAATLLMLTALLCAAVVGSLFGAERAGAIFNSNPAIIYWMSLVFLLVAGIFTFRRLYKKPGLLLIHLGCVLILCASMWSSKKAHSIRSQITGDDKIAKGQMAIYEGYQENRPVDSQTGELGVLPFIIRLEDFWIEYHYSAGKLIIDKDGQDPPDGAEETSEWTFPIELPAVPGAWTSLPEPLEKVTVLRSLRNLKVSGRVTDRPKDELNPAIEVGLEWSDGSKKATYIFPQGTGHPAQIGELQLTYLPGEAAGVRDYYSDLTVLDYEEKVQLRQQIEVNRPLHYRGYHFYQSSYGREMVNTSAGEKMQEYTVVSVVSDSGLDIVFAGYLMLCCGVIWQCWLAPIFLKRHGNQI